MKKKGDHSCHVVTKNILSHVWQGNGK